MQIFSGSVLLFDSGQVSSEKQQVAYQAFRTMEKVIVIRGASRGIYELL